MRSLNLVLHCFLSSIPLILEVILAYFSVPSYFDVTFIVISYQLHIVNNLNRWRANISVHLKIFLYIYFSYLTNRYNDMYIYLIFYSFVSVLFLLSFSIFFLILFRHFVTPFSSTSYVVLYVTTSSDCHCLPISTHLFFFYFFFFRFSFFSSHLSF